VGQAIRAISADVWEFVLESLPERRRARYGDVEYDWEHSGIDTTAATVSGRARLLAALAGAPYQPTEPRLFVEMLSALPIDFSRFRFVDIGSGKGRTLLMASELNFRHVVGVELVPELHQVAVRNIAASGKMNIESICMDAREYPFPPDPLVVYLFNPLPAGALTRVIENLQRSLAEHPREVKIIYHNPLSEEVLANTTFLKKLCGTHQYVIYSS
jgi:SAM-dependent methyltransferase